MLPTSFGWILTTVFMGTRTAPVIIMARRSNTSGGGPHREKCRAVSSRHRGLSRTFRPQHIVWLAGRVRPERDYRQGFYASNFIHKNRSISIYYEIITRHSLLR